MQTPDRRSFIKQTVAVTAAAAIGAGARADEPTLKNRPALNTLPMGKIGNLQVSRMILGGNLLTHFTHSRDLRYVYALTAHYNTPAKIVETLFVAEQHGVNTLTIHNPPDAMKTLMRQRKEGGKMQWIVCPTAMIKPDLNDYEYDVKVLLEQGANAIYVWGVRSDQLLKEGRIDLIGKAVELAKKYNVPSGVGAHDLGVIQACEKAGIPADFYIKTFHHHKYPSAPRPEQIHGAISENPGYWCKDPQATIETMHAVEKPWIAFKIMAAGAIPPKDAFTYAFNSGADHILVGMFDFEVADDVKIAQEVLGAAKRSRPWRS